MLGAYRLAVAGVLLGAIPASEVLSRQPSTPEVPRWSTQQQADLAWLDGLLAYLEHDPHRLASARRTLSDNPSPFAALLDRSLTALAIDLAGDRERAARELVELEAAASATSAWWTAPRSPRPRATSSVR